MREIIHMGEVFHVIALEKIYHILSNNTSILLNHIKKSNILF